MKISLVVSTYNWAAALELVLLSALRQTRLPDEVLVADDGSAAPTRLLLERMAPGFPVPLRHVWQDDHGFRAARARNRAIAACSGDYVLLVDGDMLLQREFVADHAAAARRGSFVQGMRALTGPATAQRLLGRRQLDLSPFEAGIERRRHLLRLPRLSALLQRLGGRTNLRGIKSCNQGWWRDDLLHLNGFDERMLGWGREDEELAARALHAGLRRRDVRFAALAVHLWHPRRHVDGASSSDRWLAETLARRRVRADDGLDQHLEGFARWPAADLRAAPPPPPQEQEQVIDGAHLFVAARTSAASPPGVAGSAAG